MCSRPARPIRSRCWSLREPHPHVVVAHDWLTNWAGAEQALRELVKVSVASDVVTAIADPIFAKELLPEQNVRTLWPNRLPHAQTAWQRYAPALMGAWATCRIEADVLIASSHFAAHAATVRFNGPSIAYYYTPARLLWRPDLELTRLPRNARSLAMAALPALRAYDRWVAQHPTVVLAISHSIARRIKDAYGRDARVVHPPVDTERWSTVERKEPRHVLWFGRLVSYKQPQLALEAARAAGLPIVFVGEGPERPRLEALGYDRATFLGRADESTVRAALAEAIALIHPGEEDFGMTAVEAQAASVPVVALDAGGARETVIDGSTGFLVRNGDAWDFGRSLRQAESRTWDATELRANAKRYGVHAFRARMAAVLVETLGQTREPA